MENNIENKVKELVSDFKLEEALDVLIAQAQTQTQRKQNTLLVLKGKLAMLEEQNLSGMLDPAEVAQQKATIAHQILDIADGSPLDHELPQPNPAQVTVQKTVSVPANGSGMGKYLLIGALLVGAILAGIFISKNKDAENPGEAKQPKPEQPSQVPTTTADHNDTAPAPASDGPLKVLDFPNIKKQFNFLDFAYEFAWADAEWVSDTEIRLKIRSYITCKNNFGICYRANLRIYADGKAISPTDQSNTDGWVEKGAIITDDIAFILPANTKEFLVELSREKSTWMRPFKILGKH